MQIDRFVAERRRQKKTKRKYILASAVVIVAYLIAYGIFYFIVRSPAFQLKNYVIQGETAVPQTAIADLLTAALLRRGDLVSNAPDSMKNLLGFKNLLVWPDALPSSTVALVPQLSGVTIAKNYVLHTVTVTVTERQPFAVWCTMATGQCFWFDIHGTAFAQALDTQGGAIAVIHDYSQTSTVLGGPVLPPALMPDMVSIIQTLRASGVNVQDMALNDISLQEIDVTIANGPILKFSLRFSASEDLPVLENLTVKPGFNKLQYVDFTVENRAYYQ